MSDIKKTILNDFKLTESQFDTLIWRANRVLMYRREDNLIKFQSNDKWLERRTSDNYFRQKNHFRGEINNILKINENLFKNDFFDTIIEYLKEEKNDVESIIDIALYPSKNPEINRNKPDNRFWNSGSYFIDD